MTYPIRRMKRSLIAMVAVSLAGWSSGLRAASDFPSAPVPPRPVTAGPGHDDYWPGFSRDGTRLYFSRRSAGKPWQLYQVPVAGGEAVPLFSPPPSPSATRVSRSKGGRLAFLGAGEIWITDENGLHPEKLAITGITGSPSYPSWYPDEKHLLIVAYQGKMGGTLHRVEIASGKAAAVTDPGEIRAGMPAVSPDGAHIIFAGQPDGGGSYDQDRNSIWILDRDHEPRPLIDHQGRAATWSPSGKWIAYESRHGSPDQRQAIFIASPDGKTDQRITPYESNSNHPVWSPDGNSLAVSIATPGHPGRTCIAVIPLTTGE